MIGVLAQSLTDPPPQDNWFDQLPLWSKYAMLAAFVVVAAIAIESIRRNGTRDREVKAAALGAGFEYSQTDPAGIGSLQLAAFGHGKGTTVSNVVTNRKAASVVRAFDFASFTEYTTNERQREQEFVDTLWGVDGWGGGDYVSSKKKIYSKSLCGALVKIDAFMPAMTIMPTNLLTRAFEKIGVEDIDFESEEFNRAYDVRCGDRRFASLFLNAPMIQFILDFPERRAFETFGNYVACYGRMIEPKALVALATKMAELPTVIDPLVSDEYPAVGGVEYRQAVQQWSARPDGARGVY